MPTNRSNFAFPRFYKTRAGVAHPGAVGRNVPECDALPVEFDLAQYLAGRLFAPRTIDKDPNFFALVELADDLGVNPRNRAELAWPVAALVRPGDTGRFVGLPFSGHAKAKRGRQWVQRLSLPSRCPIIIETAYPLAGTPLPLPVGCDSMEAPS